jgi:hypothetical protein
MADNWGKNPDVDLKYFILIAFARQQMLRERVKMLRYTCIVRLVYFHFNRPKAHTSESLSYTKETSNAERCL